MRSNNLIIILDKCNSRFGCVRVIMKWGNGAVKSIEVEMGKKLGLTKIEMCATMVYNEVFWASIAP